MQEFLTSLLGSTQGILAYATVFGILVACGLGVPLPEDISLILGGFLAHKGAASLSGMMAIGFAGILVGDSLIFLAGRRLGSQVGRSPTGFFARIVTPEKRAKVEGLFGLHGQKIVMIARFLPGVRAVTYFTAGSAGMSYGRFIFWDGLAALLSAPFFVWLGFHFGDKLDYAIERMKEGQLVVFGMLAVGGLAAFLWRKRVVAQRGATLKSPVNTGLPTHLLSGVASEGPSAAPSPVFEMAEKASGTEGLRIRE
ncbi:DedA family protein [Melittangium boletus]|uniref:Membrane protein n=1 Tax=Melittangium boletus DSM 14713 TaxID=1294270 RepID=A0A250IR22_9BACT|nr:DedA family protein [Melittangium boletus]ATB33703.1 membrane protein [Melittangium boletus DSM 14713]